MQPPGTSPQQRVQPLGWRVLALWGAAVVVTAAGVGYAAGRLGAAHALREALANVVDRRDGEARDRAAELRRSEADPGDLLRTLREGPAPPDGGPAAQP